MTETKDLITLKNEPLTQQTLNLLVENKSFVSGLNKMAKRAIEKGAEGGLVVYKKIGFNKLIIFKSYGLSDIGDNPALFGVQEDTGAHVSLSDPSESQRRRIGLGPSSYIRIGNFHCHSKYGARFSGPDLQNYEELAFGNNRDLNIVCSREMFELVGYVDHRQSTFNLFGVSLSKVGPISNEYQLLGDNNTTEEQQMSFSRCGFRVALLKIPVNIKRISLNSSNLKGLVALGS
jgi:hypothetical protein